MTSAWRRLPGHLGHVRLDGPRPALRTGSGAFLRLHRVPAGGQVERRRYLSEVAEFARARAAREADVRWPQGRREVLVVGGDALARDLSRELGRLGAAVRRRATLPADGEVPALVVAVNQLGARAAATRGRLAQLPPRSAVLQGHADGGSFVLLPLVVDGTEATLDQVRRRRVAASPAGSELDSWLDAAPRTPLPRAVTGLALARLVGAAQAWAREDEEVEALRRTMSVVHPDLRETRHVVLGFEEPPARAARPT